MSKSWGGSLAARILSGYIAEKYDMDALTIRRFNPPMGAMPFFNNSASATIRAAELEQVAGKIIKFLKDIDIKFEQGFNYSKAIKELTASMIEEEDPSSKMVEALDKCYRFRDEK